MLKTVRQFHMIYILIIIITALNVFIHCDSINPLSPGPQPVILEPAEHEPVLNVFGLLRPDNLQEMPLSFVHLEYAYPASDIPDSSIVTDAEVQIRKLAGDSVLIAFDFEYTSFDGFFDREYRHRSFLPDDGQYQLYCHKQGFPVLMAETLMPEIPIIREGSLRYRDDRLLFEIVRDERAGLYEVVLNTASLIIKNRFLRPESGDVPISILTERQDSCLLIIYVYDLNLSTYLTSNVSIKPDTYQDDFSTVNNGTGCFGSLNVFEQTIAF